MRIALALLLILPSALHAGVQEGPAAKRRGDYGKAHRQFLPLAKEGDARAMITLGLRLQEGGSGLAQDYDEALDWYVQAFEAGDGDAYSNVGARG